MDESLLDTDILNEVLKQLSDRLELRFGIVQGQEGPERPLAEREPVGGRGEVEDDLLRLVGELEEVEDLGDPGPGDIHPDSQGRLGQLWVGVELGAELTGLLEEALDGGRPTGRVRSALKASASSWRRREFWPWRVRRTPKGRASSRSGRHKREHH